MTPYLKIHAVRSTIYIEYYEKVHNFANFGGYAAILVGNNPVKHMPLKQSW